jgi:glutamyl-Q tRNA(Asp) synthetase
MTVTRFAPSPTGYLHLGHAYSALFAAKAGDGFFLRIEDIDPVRCKPEFTDAIVEDLGWLGLIWPQPVRLQSQHLADYAQALDKLKEQKLVYPCFCTRRDIEQQAQGAVHAPHAGDVTLIYPGTCRHLSDTERAEKLKHSKANWRLDVEAAMRQTGPLTWHDRMRSTMIAEPQQFGDVVLARKDVPTSYHLSVTVDDHLQAVTLVTRGEDLFSSTHIHRLLQALLNYQTPDYHHHGLSADDTGRRYAKRDQSVTLRGMRAQGRTREDVLRQIKI